ncbi:MAG: isoleucine--tRNA ligase [Nitriliruptorales bacterium]|nr:isoleucine--tRNA ligase [Nitriliruptorales bacterium]
MVVAFEPVAQQPDFPALEEAVLARWRKRDIFRRSLEQTAGGPLFRFYEGPPTANGLPGVHHVEARVFKDLFPRYRTMKGHQVPRKGGWDCHGIPVELEVEKELGFTRKQDIEDYGVAEFNARCRESVTRYVEQWERLTERIGFWVDTDDAYWTMSTSYVESVWWSLKQLWTSDLIYEGHRVVPYCPRCGTALSDHEVAQGYATTVDPSIYVRLPVREGPLAVEGASLLVWTTTPWTLISNTAVAIGPGIPYVLVRGPGDDFPVVMASDRVTEVLGETAQVLREVRPAELEGLHYRGPFDFVTPEPVDDGADPDWRYVTVGDFVTTAEGTGIVHLAPAFGEDDMRVARTHGLPVVNPVDLEGRFDARVAPFAGQFVKAADTGIVEDLRARGLLLRAEQYTHTYPFCWRCNTPLLYYAKPSWYIATTKIRDRLLSENAEVDWRPEHIRDGRYGDWLANNVDWALSRERYWGTPLPLWRCSDCGTVTAVGSRAELGHLAGRDLSDLDPHRPYVDEIRIDCAACGGRGSGERVPEVIDAWYDSGSMPFAQFGYPYAPGSDETFTERFPADYICEGIDQTRGWFYSLQAVSTLLFDRGSYRRVLCLGHIVDADGRKMSKSLGNVLDPWALIESRGADALRWLLLTDGSPWKSRRVGEGPLGEVVRKFLLTLWNTYCFFVIYARLDGWTPPDLDDPTRRNAPADERPIIDRWVLAELAETVRVVDAAMEDFDPITAGRQLARFVDDLSNWYVRRSRNRFWKTDAEHVSTHDTEAAFATLHECLVTVAALLAPFTPFVADELYENLVRNVEPQAPDSVHLLAFPTPDPAAADNRLRATMAAARRIVELGRRARQEARIAGRQPLRTALITLPAEDHPHWADVEEVVADELNVKSIELPDSVASLVNFRLKPDFRALGPVFGPLTPKVAAAIEDADPDALAAALAAWGSAAVTVDDEPVRVTTEQVQVLEVPAIGWQVAREGPYSVALDLDVDRPLRLEGLARELIRAINDLRKRAGFALSDRVVLHIEAVGDLAEALERHGSYVAREVLAAELRTEIDLDRQGRWSRGAPPGSEIIELTDDARALVRLEAVA